jgi:hypothetical protein
VKSSASAVLPSIQISPAQELVCRLPWRSVMASVTSGGRLLRLFIPISHFSGDLRLTSRVVPLSIGARVAGNMGHNSRNFRRPQGKALEVCVEAGSSAIGVTALALTNSSFPKASERGTGLRIGPVAGRRLGSNSLPRRQLPRGLAPARIFFVSQAVAAGALPGGALPGGGPRPIAA